MQLMISIKDNLCRRLIVDVQMTKQTVQKLAVWALCTGSRIRGEVRASECQEFTSECQEFTYRY